MPAAKAKIKIVKTVQDNVDHDNPEWSVADFKRAQGPASLSPLELAAFPKTRGRPKTGIAKRLVSIRLEQSVIDALRATGPGWQKRANDILKSALE
jgi:uncharacterized protein (DUF4415 family)